MINYPNNNYHSYFQSISIRTIIFRLVVLFILLIVHIGLMDFAFDDAYIHFRIARNFLEYGVPYYNHTEMVMASSSSGWTLVVTTLFSIWKEPYIVSIFNAITTLIGAIIFSMVLFNGKRKLIGEFIYISILLFPSIGLMETSLTMLLVLLALFFLQKDRPIAYIILGIIPFFRLETAILSVLLFVLFGLRNKQQWAKMLFGMITGGLPFLFYDLIFFHTVVPNTIVAKLVGYEADFRSLFFSLIGSLVMVNQGLITFVYVFITIILFLIARRKLFALPMVEIIFLAWGWSVALLYLLSHSLIFPWYVPLYSIPIIGILSKGLINTDNVLSKIGVSFLIIPLIWFTSTTVYSATVNKTLYKGYLSDARVNKYIEIGEELFQKYPNANMMTSEIGGLGWGFQGQVTDGFGLVTPIAVQFHHGANGVTGIIPLEFIDETKPDIIVSHPVFIQDFIESELSSNYFVKEYSIFTNPEVTLWGDNKILVYIRSDYLK